jgi:RimJ/RimL family protein N-acetyltransferase
VRLRYGDDVLVAYWVAARIPHMESGADFGPCKAIGVENSRGELIGGVVYHNYMPVVGNIELSFAADTAKWLTRPIICGLLSYPFDQLQCQRVTGVTPRRATSARRFLDQFGFKREGCVRRGFGTDHAIISGLLREEWQASKWAKPRTRRQESAGVVHGIEEQDGRAA